MKLGNSSSGIGISFVLHCLVVALLLFLTRFEPKMEKAMVIDFTIAPSRQAPLVAETPKKIEQPRVVNPPPAPKRPPEKSSRRVRREPVKPVEPKPEKKEQPVPRKIEVTEEKTARPKTEEIQTVPLEEEQETLPEAMAETEPEAGPEKPTAGEPQPEARMPLAASGLDAGPASPVQEDPKAVYIKAHFEYIKNEIQQRIIYPLVARKKGWQGRVIVSFVVREDGNVEKIVVRESSGFPLLDTSAVKTIQQAAPFPAPPCRAELVVPISYSLV